MSYDYDQGRIEQASSTLNRIAEQAKGHAEWLVEQEGDLGQQEREGLILPAVRQQKVGQLRAEADRLVEDLIEARRGAIEQADSHHGSALQARLTGLPQEARERALRLMNDGGYGKAADAAEHAQDPHTVAALLLEARYDKDAPPQLLASLEARLARIEAGPFEAYSQVKRDAHVAQEALHMLSGAARGRGRAAVARGLVMMGHARNGAQEAS